MLNLFIGIIVNTMQTMHTAEHTEERKHIEDTVHQDTSRIEQEMRALRAEIRALRGSLSLADRADERP